MNLNQDERGRFKKGNTCGGRKKIPEEFELAVLSYSNEALQTVVRIMKSKKSSEAIRLKAAIYLLDRGFGCPSRSVTIGQDPETKDDGFLLAFRHEAEIVFSTPEDVPEGLEDVD